MSATADGSHLGPVTAFFDAVLVVGKSGPPPPASSYFRPSDLAAVRQPPHIVPTTAAAAAGGCRGLFARIIDSVAAASQRAADRHAARPLRFWRIPVVQAAPVDDAAAAEAPAAPNAPSAPAEQPSKKKPRQVKATRRRPVSRMRKQPPPRPPKPGRLPRREEIPGLDTLPGLLLSAPPPIPNPPDRPLGDLWTTCKAERRKLRELCTRVTDVSLSSSGYSMLNHRMQQLYNCLRDEGFPHEPTNKFVYDYVDGMRDVVVHEKLWSAQGNNHRFGKFRLPNPFI